MQLDRIKSGIAAYGIKPWGQINHGSPTVPTTRRQHTAFLGTNFIFGSINVSATSGVVILAEPAFLFNPAEVMLVSCVVEPQPEVVSAQPTVNPVLEMRSARRSLRDKAQEVMSDFEREYPW